MYPTRTYIAITLGVSDDIAVASSASDTTPSKKIWCNLKLVRTNRRSALKVDAWTTSGAKRCHGPEESGLFVNDLLCRNSGNKNCFCAATKNFDQL